MDFRILMICFVASTVNQYANAGAFELGFGFSYSISNYGEDSFSWTRRWNSTLGYHFTQTSGIELGFQDSVSRTKYKSIEDTTFHDRLYSLNYVQAIFPRTFPIQPYFKIGAGQLNRDAYGVYWTGDTPPAEVDSLTAVLGFGMRIYVNKNFNIKMEVTSYLPGAKLSTFKDNLSFNIGSSIFF